MSARICHACISYLNSWQSFKNRCYAAQKKQRSHLEAATANNNNNGATHSPPTPPTPPSFAQPKTQQHSHVMNQQQILQHAAATQRQRAIQEQRAHMQKQRILKNALISGSKQAKSSLPGAAAQPLNAFNASAGIDVVCLWRNVTDCYLEQTN